MGPRNAEIVRRFVDGESGYALGVAFGVCPERIYQIVRPHTSAEMRRSRQANLTPEARRAGTAKRVKTMRALAEEGLLQTLAYDREGVLADLRSGLTFGQIARKHDITRSAVAGCAWRWAKRARTPNGDVAP